MNLKGFNPIRIVSNIGTMLYNLVHSIKDFRNSKDFTMTMSFILLILVVLYLVSVWLIVFYFKVV
jgi:hypothetical protein